MSGNDVTGRSTKLRMARTIVLQLPSVTVVHLHACNLNMMEPAPVPHHSLQDSQGPCGFCTRFGGSRSLTLSVLINKPRELFRSQSHYVKMPSFRVSQSSTTFIRLVSTSESFSVIFLLQDRNMFQVYETKYRRFTSTAKNDMSAMITKHGISEILKYQRFVGNGNTAIYKSKETPFYRRDMTRTGCRSRTRHHSPHQDVPVRIRRRPRT